MTRQRKIVVGLAAVAVLAAAGAGAWAYAASCTQSAAYALYSGSYMDTMLNPPKAEDVEFFTSTGGVPNIMILLDTSGSMVRLPPNGPSTLGTLPPEGTVGCGLDSATSAASLTGSGTAFGTLGARTWSSPCGSSLTTSAVGRPYDPTLDYAHEASVCPHYVNPNPVTGADGYDPDWYCGSGADAAQAKLSCSGNTPNLFDKNIVLHDGGPTNNATYSSSTMAGYGWSDSVVSPHLTSKNKPATVAEVCADLKSKGYMAATQDGVDTAAICAQCLNTKGWFLDGRVWKNVDLGDITGQTVPSIWYTGNYLSFYPPKFVVARKVLKDTIMGFSKVRAAITTFSSSGGDVIQQFNPTCDHPESNFDSNRVTYMNALNGVGFSGGTPLSKALLDIGMYYHSTDLPWFDKTWGSRTPWANGQAPGSTAGSYSICYSCQVSSVIVVTDGVPNPDNDACKGSTPPLPVGTAARSQATGGTYAGDTTTGIIPACGSTSGGVSSTDCPECWLFPLASDYKNNLTRVAWYLHNFDLRKNSEATKDCQFNGGRQTIDFYAIGFNNSYDPDAATILGSAAKVGGGIFVPAGNADEVRAGLTQILETINTRSTSFSVATLSTLQSQAGHSVIVPRFDPVKGPFWDGHLFRFELYSEFVNNCTPGGAGDIDCDGTCGGVFLQDKLGNFIQEDGSGSFKVNEPNLPSCNESKCGAGKCGLPGGADATPWWDAGKKLADMTWKQRRVYTAVDENGDGRIDASDYPGGAPLQLAATNAVADKLIPYMNLVGTNVCT
jgi:type IV pilus assembly protein PilY1